MDTPAAPAPQRTRRDCLAAAALAAVAFAVFAPALGHEFVNYDDPDYVTANRHVTAGLTAGGAYWALTAFHTYNWHPLTWLSLQLDASLWKGADAKPDPRGFHLTNVLLHAANAALLFLALRSLTGAYWRSLAAALLFAVHPLRAESVAWVSERKDVLSACFGLLTLWAYARYVRAPSPGRYLAVLASFALSLLAKPMLVTLPCLLLVLDWWPLGRWQARGFWPLLREKLPLFVLAAASAVVTVRAQAGEGAVAGLTLFPADVRAANAVLSYAAYLAKTVWPAGLAVYYPHPVYPYAGGLPPAQVAAAGFLLAAITAGAAALRGRAPYLLAGWLWYLGSLVPVIGLVQVGSQAYADRYTYLPQVGLLIAACWGAADLARARPGVALAAAGAAAVALAALTWRQLPAWHDSVSLWQHALGVARDNPVARLNLGLAFEQQGNDKEAAAQYREAIRLDPRFARALGNLGNLLLRRGGPPNEALRLLREACRAAPGSALMRTNLANALLRQGQLDEAARQFNEAIRLDPALVGAAAHDRLGEIEASRGNAAAAADFFREALRRQPDFPEARAGLGAALVQLGQAEEGLRLLREAVRAAPRFERGHVQLGEALEKTGDLDGAATHFGEATRLRPEVPLAWLKLGGVRARQGRTEEAVDCFSKAAAAHARAGRFADAAAAGRSARARAEAAGRTDLVRQVDGWLSNYERARAAPAPPGASP
jgi:tetratricopeptide (TPR) repeat protein